LHYNLEAKTADTRHNFLDVQRMKRQQHPISASMLLNYNILWVFIMSFLVWQVCFLLNYVIGTWFALTGAEILP